MAAPIVSWRTDDNASQVTQWDIGTVEAGSTSASRAILIWNNWNGDTDVSDMTATTITTKDNSGGNTGELVMDTWVECKVDSLEETQYFPIGGLITRDLKAQDGATPIGVIGGLLNAGDISSETNYCAVSLRANVPPDATAGLVNFYTRVSFQYV